MGKCISCDKETDNEYYCQAGEQLSSENTGAVTITNYCILENFYGFACSSCIYPLKKNLHRMGIAAIVAFVGILTGTLFAGISQFLGWFGFGLMMFCSGIYILYLIGQFIMGWFHQPDKRVSSEKGGNFISQFKAAEIKGKYPNCTILVPKDCY